MLESEYIIKSINISISLYISFNHDNCDINNTATALMHKSDMMMNIIS